MPRNIPRAEKRATREAKHGPAVPMQRPGEIRERLFDDPCDQLEYEARNVYLHIVPPSQRAEYPWGKYLIDPDFLVDIEDHVPEHISRYSVVRAVCDVICGLWTDVGSYHARQLTLKDKGCDRENVMTRPDGAVAWRLNMQNNTPGARRLMFWQRPDGIIEIARLAHHDDVQMSR